MVKQINDICSLELKKKFIVNAVPYKGFVENYH